jgi:L-lactate dehydrogenase complex protein LldG
MQPLKTSKAKERILGKIRKGLSNEQVPLPFPEAEKENRRHVFEKTEHSIEEQFAEAFIKLGGRFIFCNNEQELLYNIHALYDERGWTELLCAEEPLLPFFLNNKLDFVKAANAQNETADACITGCEVLVARTGSALFSSKQHLGRIAPVFYPVHIIVAYANQIVPDIQDALDFMKQKYDKKLPSMINLNTGPSRTADIEKTLVVGVHGPKEVFCFFVNTCAPTNAPL